MKYFFIIILMVLFILPPLFGQWPRHTIDNNCGMPYGIDAGDLDGDGDPDVIITTQNTGKIIWYRNNFRNWQENQIDDLASIFPWVGIVDMDNDQDNDFIVSGHNSSIGILYWYENDNQNWTPHIIEESPEYRGIFALADIDTDGDDDIVLTTWDAGKVLWYERDVMGDSLVWSRHEIDTSLTLAHVIDTGDLDGDDTMDVVVDDKYTGEIFWYKNSNGGFSWPRTLIGTKQGLSPIAIADMNADSMPDIVAGSPGTQEVMWFQNPDWNKHIVGNIFTSSCYNIACYIDQDSSLDLIVTSTDEDKIFWYRNNNLNWEEYLIDETLDGPRIFVCCDMDDDSDRDLVVCGLADNKVVWYENQVGTAHALTVQTHPRYIPTARVFLTINSQVLNLYNHPVSVQAIISAQQHAFTDTIPLYDDGQHNDSLASDNIWGTKTMFSGLQKDNYKVGILTHDLTTNDTIYLPETPCFTTIGPVVFDHYSITSSDTIPDAGDKLKFEFTLRNEDNSATAQQITAMITSPDTMATIIGGHIPINFNDIAANSIVTSSNKKYIEFGDTFLGHYDTLFFHFEISSNGHVFWYDDNMQVVVNLDPDQNNLLQDYILYQNYPNPFNPATNIQFQIPENEFVTLKIYNLLGQEVATLVSEKFNPGMYSYTWDASDFASGVYYYRLQAGTEFVQTRKLVLLR